MKLRFFWRHFLSLQWSILALSGVVLPGGLAEATTLDLGVVAEDVGNLGSNEVVFDPQVDCRPIFEANPWAEISANGQDVNRLPEDPSLKVKSNGTQNIRWQRCTLYIGSPLMQGETRNDGSLVPFVLIGPAAGVQYSVIGKDDILFLLHGSSNASDVDPLSDEPGGTHFEKVGLVESLDKLVYQIGRRPMWVVMPQDTFLYDEVDSKGQTTQVVGRDYWIGDGDKRNWSAFVDSLIANEVFEEVISRIRSSDENRAQINNRVCRAIGGISMGAHGALDLADRLPRRFSAVGAFSPVFRTKWEDNVGNMYRHSLGPESLFSEKAVGIKLLRALKKDQNQNERCPEFPFFQIVSESNCSQTSNSLSISGMKNPSMYFDIGVEDHLLIEVSASDSGVPEIWSLLTELEDPRIKVFQTDLSHSNNHSKTPSNHSDSYWAARMPDYLEFFANAFDQCHEIQTAELE